MNYHEPWRVRPYDLEKVEPSVILDINGGEPWMNQNWAIIASNSEHEVASVGFRTAPSEWGPTPSYRQAIAYRDRIIACVNACAGMEDPEEEIPYLRDLASQVQHIPATAPEENSGQAG